MLGVIAGVPMNQGLQQHCTSVNPGSVMAGILRNPFAIGVIKASLSVAPCIVTGQGVFLQKNGMWRRCSKLVMVALAPVSITAQSPSMFSGESRVMGGGGKISGWDSSSASSGDVDACSVGSGWTSTELARPTKVFSVILMGLRLMSETSSVSMLELDLQVVAMESVVPPTVVPSLAQSDRPIVAPSLFPFGESINCPSAVQFAST